MPIPRGTNYIDYPGNDCEGSVDNPWTECSQNLYLDETSRQTKSA